jgi:hypothetical protein
MEYAQPFTGQAEPLDGNWIRLFWPRAVGGRGEARMWRDAVVACGYLKDEDFLTRLLVRHSYMSHSFSLQCCNALFLVFPDIEGLVLHEYCMDTRVEGLGRQGARA